MPNQNTMIAVFIILILSYDIQSLFFLQKVEAFEHESICNDNDSISGSCSSSSSSGGGGKNNSKVKLKRKQKQRGVRFQELEYPYDEEYCQCLPLHQSTLGEKARSDIGKEGGGEEGEDDSGGARIAYLITIHNQRTLQQSLQLLKNIASPGFIILMHIDTKFPTDEYENSDLMSFINESYCNGCGATIMVDSIYNCTWGQWSMVEPTLWAMEQLTNNPKFKNQWDVFINLSADSMPVYTPITLSKYYFNVHHGPLSGLNFVTSSSCLTGLRPTNINFFPKRWHKSGHYMEGGPFAITYIDDGINNNDGSNSNTKSKVSSVELEIHFGSQWMTLTPHFVEYIATSMKNSNSLAHRFKEELIRRKKLMSDETFIPTLLANHATFQKTMPKLMDDGNLESAQGFSAIRYERMDENMPDPFMNVVKQQRYDVPTLFQGIIESPRPWGPYYLGIYDLANIKLSGALFIRKVADELDPNLANILPVNDKDEIPYIQWPEELKITEKIDWEMMLKKLQGR